MTGVQTCALPIYLRQRREERPEYDPDDYPEPEPRRTAPKEPAPARRKNAAIDIPVDDGPLLSKKPTTPVSTVRKKSFFDKVAGVAVPGREDKPVLEEEPPEYEDVAELRPMKEPPRTPKPSPVAPPPDMGELTAPPAPTPLRAETPPPPVVREDPVPPPVIREPAPPKRSKEEEREQVREEVAREIEAGMEQDAPAYRYPPVTLLNQGGGGSASAAEGELHANQQRLQDALQSFGDRKSVV